MKEGLSTPSLSIITVTFNAESELPRTLESLAKQSSSSFESIVVDGGSTDGTLDIARDFIHLLRLTLVSEPDDGLYDAMNKGLEIAVGEFVLFLNAGDYLADNKVISDLEALLNELPSTPPLIYGQTIIRHADGAVWERPIRPLDYIKHGQPSLHQATIFDRQTHRAHHYPFRDYQISADYAVMAAIHLEHGSEIVTWERPVAVFVNDPGSVSNSQFFERVGDAWRVQRDILRVSIALRIASALRRIAANIYYNFRRTKKD